MQQEPVHTGPSRRQFLRDTALAGLATVSGLVRCPASAQAAPSRPAVAVLGGGVAGLSAALELAERNFRVTVYERKALGGKARSIPVPQSAADGRRPLPGEHGFRVFPGFYWNLGDTMRRIPFAGNRQGTWDNLVHTTAYRLSRSGGPDLTVPLPFSPSPNPAPYTPESLVETIAAGLREASRLPAQEAAYFARRILVYMTSCDERRFGQWEHVTWSDFIRADTMSQEYRRLFAHGTTQNLVATRAREASAHTVGLVGEAIIWSSLGRGNEPGGSVDRLLNGSTSERLIDPWITHLRALGVEFCVDHRVEKLHLAKDRIVAATIHDPLGRARTITADWFLSAIPIERFVQLLSPGVLAVDPNLQRVQKLRTEWMNGLMFYLRRRLPLTPGHVNYVDSPWALTSVSQAQFWRRDFRDYGDGTVLDCLSTIISDWNTAGSFNNKPAKDCTPDEIAREVWAQLKAHLDDTGQDTLRDDLIHSWFLDPAITGPGTSHVANDEPLFIQNAGSWANRPESVTAIRNLFLAGDWVRTNINLATMEGANEGARQAVNALLDAAGSAASRCRLRGLFRPPEFDHLKSVDRARYRQHQPNLFDNGDLLP
ncbi:MAG: FAD-dependent oxidoreductase [Actinomycetota bacterium]|nr:FAD-dependent oxidoreductase [Actinomycetota bacterium]